MMKTATQTSTVSFRDSEQKFETIRASPPFHSEALHSQKTKIDLEKDALDGRRISFHFMRIFGVQLFVFGGWLFWGGFAKKD